MEIYLADPCSRTASLPDQSFGSAVSNERVTPRNVIKEAFAARIPATARCGIDMLDHRNLLSHTYEAATFDTALLAVRDRYLRAIEELHLWLMEREDRCPTRPASRLASWI
jgi:hypothetical protein